MSDALTDADYAALADFRFSLRTFLAFSEGKAAECGLTPQQHQALLAIRAAPAGQATIGHLAERLILKPHSATGLVDRLEALGFVTRCPSPLDRRQTLLELTAGAHAMLAALSTRHREEIRRIRPVLLEMLEQIGP